MSHHHSPKILTDGLVFYVDFANSKSYSGGSVVRDLAGTVGAGTVNGPTFSSDKSGVFSFDGSNDYISFPNSTALDNQNITVIVWARTDSTSQNGFWFEKGQVNTQYSLFQEGANIVWRTHTGSGYHSQYTTTASFINTSDYFQVAGTFRTGTKTTYVNGVARTTEGVTATISTNNAGIRIGSYISGGYFYRGNIASVAVFNRTLTAAEIQQNYNALKGRFGL